MYRIVIGLSALLVTAPLASQPLTASEIAAVDKAVEAKLRETGVPSASIAIVRNRRTVFTRAYGKASETIPQARVELPYQIASISKQFTGMALLLLEDDGKLSLDDQVAKWVPGVTGGDGITIRQLLAHQSGLQDNWPQDYSFAAMEKATTPQGIVDVWGKKPLDYEPGTRYQYSNTGYVVAGMIIEKAAGEPLMAFLKRRIFDLVGIVGLDQDDTNTPAYPAGYKRNALGPVRLATVPGRGWMFASGMLSMSAPDLAKWNIARLNRTILPAEDWAEQEKPVLRIDGTSTGYALGVINSFVRERRTIGHNGAAVGFLTQNWVYPDSGAAITVLTNADYSGASGALVAEIEKIVLSGKVPPTPPEGDRIADVRTIYSQIAVGTLNRKLVTENLNYYFEPTTLADYRSSLAPLGQLSSVEITRPPSLRGGFVNRNYKLRFLNRTLSLTTYAEPGANGRWEQFYITPE